MIELGKVYYTRAKEGVIVAWKAIKITEATSYNIGTTVYYFTGINPHGKIKEFCSVGSEKVYSSIEDAIEGKPTEIWFNTPSVKTCIKNTGLEPCEDNISVKVYYWNGYTAAEKEYKVYKIYNDGSGFKIEIPKVPGRKTFTTPEEARKGNSIKVISF